MLNESDILHDNPNWLVTTKLQPTRANIDLIPRPRLIEKLHHALNCKVALISAPAGFGKSTLLYQWYDILTNQGVYTAWLTLDENDADKQQFLAYIALSIEQAGVDIGELSVGARNGFSESQSRSTLTKLLSYIEQHEKKCVLLLDDYQTLISGQIDSLIKQIIHEMPANFMFVLSSRTQTKLDIPALTASGNITHISAQDIRLSKEETISALGENVSQSDIENVFKKTEGWPVAVQLVRFHNNTQLIRKNINVGASSDLIASYLTDQVISNVDEDVRDLLLHVAVLENFNPSLANAVRQKSDSWDILLRIGSFSAFLISMPKEGDWFRLHHLIAEYLRDSLRREDPQAIERIQNLASLWYEEQNHLIEAVKYAAKNEDYKRCEKLFLNAGGWKIILRQGIGVMRNMFRLIPEHVIASSGRLLIARAYLHCKDGEYKAARGLLDASLAMRPLSDGNAYDCDYSVIESLINVYEDTQEWFENESQNLVDENNCDLDSLDTGTLFAGYILSNMALQNFSKSRTGIQKSFQYLRRSESILGLNYCYIHAANLAYYQADFDLAQANILQSLELAESNFGSDSGLKHLSSIANYSTKIWLGHFGEKDHEDYLNSLRHITTNDGWCEIYLLGLDAGYCYAVASGNKKLEDEILSILTNLAHSRQLARLNRFLSALQISKIYDRNQSPSAVLSDWYKRSGADENPVLWQANYFALLQTAERFSTNDTDFESDLNEAILHSENKEAYFHNIRLKIAKILYLHRCKRPSEVHDLLIQTLKVAASQHIILPFIQNEKLVKIMRETRNELRSKSEDLILIAFIAEILSYYEKINSRRKNSLLSNRELDIIQQLALGKSNKEIARVFELTENTVKYHLKSIYKKLEVNSRTQSIAAAKSLAIID